MTSRERFLAACARQPVDRPPLWIMRQAGRYLPEYRELKAANSFTTLVRTPELAAEATLQPLRRFDFDAAILFSDILVIPDALGQGYRFRDEGGIAMEHRLESRAQIDALASADAVPERLAYVAEALRLVKRELDGKKALLGFGGSPWTLATYMVEGGSSSDFARVKALFYSDRAAFDALLSRLSDALVACFQMQIRAGADAIQIFDSWGGVLAAADYEEASLCWIRRVAAALPAGFPVILFSKVAADRLASAAGSGITVVSADASVDLPRLARAVPGTAIQGNLDPVLLNAEPGIVRREAARLLEAMRGIPGHIFNLGHGILPEARIDSVEALAATVREWK